MKDSKSVTSGVTAVTILWQRIDNNWRLGYLHASELPKEQIYQAMVTFVVFFLRFQQ